MKRLVILLLSVLLVIGIFNLSNPPERDPDMVGYVVDSDYMRVLVADGVTKEQVEKLTENELFGLDGVSAIWAKKLNFFQYRKGQKVRLWIDGPTLDSFPAKGKAEYIQKID